MTKEINRREMLTRGLGAAGLWAGGLSTIRAADQETAARSLPDRSRDAPSSPVAIQRCASYEPQRVRRQLEAALKFVGGVKKLVRNKTVTVKLNLTGRIGRLLERPAWETYQIHPNVVAALCAILADAGARRIILVECFYYREPFEGVLRNAGWDVAAVHAAGGHRVSFENTRNLGPWRSYSRLKVPWGGFLFPAFDLNQHYEKTDVFVSLAKLKDHASAGVTLAVKNLFGILPCSLYGQDALREDSIQSRGRILHSATKSVPDGVPSEIDHVAPRVAQPWQYRVPRVTADVLGARPVDLAIVEGIHTMRGGEGPWNNGLEAIEPKLLVVGRNAVCTDAVATSVMGYNPQANHMQWPFPGENHLRLLASARLGANDPGRIEVHGLSLKEARFPFRPLPAKNT